MKNTLVLIIFILIISSCSKHRPAPVSDAYRNSINSAHGIAKQNKYKRKYVTVQKGDTLYSIGFKNDIDFKRLAKINNISPPYRIYPGQKLKLTGTAVSPQSTQTKKPIKKPEASDIGSKPVVTQPPTTKPIVTQNKPMTVKTPVTQKTPPLPNANSQWIWPVKGRILSAFSSKDVSRKGIDIATPLDNSVVASNSGTVVYSGDGLRGYGELIIIKHQNNLLSAYAHNSKRLVKEGQNVKQGQAIATSGKDLTGTPLLHFEIRKNGQPVNPLGYLPK